MTSQRLLLEVTALLPLSNFTSAFHTARRHQENPA